jgi:hypothetical protein
MKLLALVLALALCFGIASALPTTGAAGDITSNGFNVTVTGVTGSDAYVTWGDFPGYENWITPNFTASGGTAVVQVIGAPLYGGEHVYYQACDNTGCGNEMDVTLAAITPIPTQTIDQFFTNITRSRFNPAVIGQSGMDAATVIIPKAVLIGLGAMFFVLGIWTRTKSVRLALILGIIILPFIRWSNSGLYLGLPSTGIDFAQGLLAAAMAGILFFFARK